MRITDGMRQNAVSQTLSSLASRQAEAARKASTGERVGAPSDDPAAAAELTRLSAARARTAAYQSSVSSARGDAELAEGTLGEAQEMFARVREIAMQGANDSLNSADRASLADEIVALKQHLVGLANAKGQNGFLFAGTATDAAPFTAAGTFVGNDVDHQVEISPGQSVRTNPSGALALTVAGGVDAFTTLDTLESALRSGGSAAVSGTLGAIDAAKEQIGAARSTAGLLLARLETTDAALSQTEIALNAHQTAVGQADPYAAYTELSSVSSSIEQALAVARIVLSTGNDRF